VLRDFVRVVTPALNTPEVSTWNLRWLLRLDGQQQQQRVPAACSLPTAKLDATCRRTTFANRICPNAVRCGQWDICCSLENLEIKHRTP
jgi:hypothetical protein